MGETRVEDTATAPRPKPTMIMVPPRGPMDSLFTNGLSGLGFSPGPMTLVSSFFSDQGPFSFSQLLAGAMASPAAAPAKPGFSFAEDNDLVKEEEKGCDDDVKSSEESGGGYKRNRPVSLSVAQPQVLSPESFGSMFMVPAGFSPSGLLNSPGFLSPLQSPFGMSHQQALAHVTAQAALSQSYIQMNAELQQRSSSTANTEPLGSESLTNPFIQTEQEISKMESAEVVSQPDNKRTPYNGVVDKPASDGYNWRKYGQKHVKASECPRSYYKCTHPNCPVKKKVERSFDGRVSEITYKGQHNHDLPQLNNKRGKDSSLDRAVSNSKNEMKKMENEVVEIEYEPLNCQANTEPSSGIYPVAGQSDEVGDNVIVIDGGDDEPVAKRRSLDAVQSYVPVTSHQTITESKIVVQTRSEVDLLDDGYRWRKYGQKVVKGNPHPRSYYKCTYAGCNVRKHVERASSDPKAVITTYEGKHNHEIPIGRRGSYDSSSAGPNSNQQLKAQRVALAKNPPPSGEIMDFGNHDKVPMTLHLKEEQIAT